jgi:hypothetical protein
MMGYYGTGDFKGSGGYYRGDPGFFSFLGKLGGGLVKSVTGIDLASGFARPAEHALAAPAAAGNAMRMVKGASSTILKTIKGHPVLSAAGAAGAAGAMMAKPAGRMLKGAEKMVGLVHRKRRRMNPCNPRALRRAIRRAHGFERLAKHVLGFSSPRKPKGHMYFKRKRKR